eukprot:gene42184-62270_t
MANLEAIKDTIGPTKKKETKEEMQQRYEQRLRLALDADRLFTKSFEDDQRLDSLSNLRSLAEFVKIEKFQDVGSHQQEDIEYVVRLIFEHKLEPPFVQRYCLICEAMDRSWTLDDVWS